MSADYKWGTAPFKHQEERFYLYRDKLAHAHLWEMRCGKSKIVIDSAAWLNLQGKITGVLVLAPAGVHINWVRQEIPTHMPQYVGCEPTLWQSNPNAEERRGLEKLTKTTGYGLRVLSMNLEAIRTDRGFEFARQFLRNYRCLLVMDEGSMIKNPTAIQTKQLLKLATEAPYRRLLNGSPVVQSPLDLFSQFAFLDWGILGRSHVTFRNRYAIVEMQGRMKNEVKKKLEGIAALNGTYVWGELTYSEMKGVVEAGLQPVADGPSIEFYVKQAGRSVYEMRWRCGKVIGSEKLFFQAGETYPVITGYRHLDELKERIAPHSDRVLKADCLDLPEKVYSKRYVELSKEQKRMYGELKKECITQAHGREMSAALAITKMLRLQQIVGGFFVPDLQPMYEDARATSTALLVGDDAPIIQRMDSNAVPIPGPNPRVDALMEDIENGLSGKGIIWARFKAEINLIAKALRQRFGAGAVAELYGDVDSSVRQNAIDLFQRPGSPLVYLVANPACKGVSRGQNMCAGEWQWYYSNSFSLEDRLQSEDREHSPGQTKNLGVIDAVAPGTLDDKVIDALRSKKNLADLVTGDKLVEWI